MIDETQLSQLQRKNRKLKSKIWNDYRNFSDELRMLKHQKKSLQNSIQIEQNKNRELIQHFSSKISQLQEQLHQVSTYTPPPASNYSSNYSFPTNKKKKDNFKWRFQELEEEGKALQMDTERAFKKCRESSSLNFWLTDITPPVSNYVFDYQPIIISPPQSIKNNQNFYQKKDDLLSSSSSSSSIPNDIPISPIALSNSRDKKIKNNKKKENDSSNSSTVSVKHDSNKYNDSDSDSINEENYSNDNSDSSPLETLKINKDSLNKNNLYDNQSKATSNVNKNQLESQDANQEQQQYAQSSQRAHFTPPHVEIPQNNKTQPTSQANNNKNNQLPSPIHIKTHLEDESDELTQLTQSIHQPNNTSVSIINNKQQKPQSEAQIIKPVVPNPNSTFAGFVSQSNWDDDDDDNEVIFDPEEIAEAEKDEKENKKNSSGGIPSDTNPILDTSDQPKSLPIQNQENKPSSKTTNTTESAAKPSTTKSGISPPGSLTSKGSFDFSIDIKDDDDYLDNNVW